MSDRSTPSFAFALSSEWLKELQERAPQILAPGDPFMQALAQQVEGWDAVTWRDPSQGARSERARTGVQALALTPDSPRY